MLTVYTLVLRSLSCQRITLHKNLFLSFVLNSIVTVVWLTTVVNKQAHTYHYSVRPRCDNMLKSVMPLANTAKICVMLQASCKLLMFIHLYLLSCNYFWMLCEGIYLHTLIVVAVFAEKQHLLWYYLLGWGEMCSLSTENQANMLKQWCHSVLLGFCRISSHPGCASFGSSTQLLQRQVRAHLIFQSLSKHFVKCPVIFFFFQIYWCIYQLLSIVR